jgi:hypothetical protein
MALSKSKSVAIEILKSTLRDGSTAAIPAMTGAGTGSGAVWTVAASTAAGSSIATGRGSH